MWARVIEVMLGLWLAASPFIFGHPADERVLWINDMVFGFAIVTLALLSFSRRLRYAHLATGVIAAWLVVFGFLTPSPAPPSSQNHILLGLLLLMFSIIPNDANLPPESWLNAPSRRKV